MRRGLGRSLSMVLLRGGSRSPYPPTSCEGGFWGEGSGTASEYEVACSTACGSIPPPPSRKGEREQMDILEGIGIPQEEGNDRAGFAWDRFNAHLWCDCW